MLARSYGLTWLVAVAASVGCSSSAAPTYSAITIQIQNATCETACASMRVAGLPTHPAFSTPGGAWNFTVATVTNSSTCIVLRDSAMFIVASTTSADTERWSPRDSLALAVNIRGIEPWPPNAYVTNGFLPASAPGWTVTLPGGAVTPSQPCTP